MTEKAGRLVPLYLQQQARETSGGVHATPTVRKGVWRACVDAGAQCAFHFPFHPGPPTQGAVMLHCYIQGGSAFLT